MCVADDNIVQGCMCVCVTVRVFSHGLGNRGNAPSPPYLLLVVDQVERFLLRRYVVIVVCNIY